MVEAHVRRDIIGLDRRHAEGAERDQVTMTSQECAERRLDYGFDAADTP